MKKNILKLLVCISLSSLPLQADTKNIQRPTTTIGYNELCPLVVASLSTTAPAQGTQENPTGSVSLTERQKHEIVYKLLAHTQQPTQDSKTINHKAIKRLLPDLNMFYVKSNRRENESAHLFSKINRTQTLLGQATLAHTIANPTNPQIILARQKAIRALFNDQATAQKLTKVLANAQSAESNFLTNLLPRDQEAKHAYDDLLFRLGPLNKLNTNTWALGFQSNVMEGIGNFGTSLLLMPYALARLDSIPRYLKHCYYNTERQKRSRTLKEVLKTSYLAGLNLTESFSVAPIGIIDGFYKGIQNRRTKMRRESQLHVQLSAAATIINTFKKTSALVNACPELKAVIPGHTLENHSKDFKQLTSILTSSTFKKNRNTWLRSPGNIRVAYNLMKKTSNELAPIAQYVGDVDALLSTAQLMKEHEGQRVGYAFAQFIDQEAPSISIDSFWNPMVDKAVVVPNDLTLGQDGKARGALVTGSNTGGKSTVMIEGLTTAVLLAHTLGIVPAQSCILTPFAYIGTSLKIHSDIASGMSHLKAEVERAKEIITDIKNQPTGSKAFVAIDELFEGASGNDGSECLYETGKNLASMPHALWVMVTQFQDKPTHLEKDTDGICKNFNIDVIKHSNGTIERPHKVALGVSKVNGIAQLLLKQALEIKQDNPKDQL